MRSPSELLDQWLTLGHQPKTVKTVHNLAVLYMQATLRAGRLPALAVLADGEIIQLRPKQAAKILHHAQHPSKIRGRAKKDTCRSAG